jgi:hypothetical protein
MRIHQNGWLFVFLVLLSFAGPHPSDADRGQTSSDSPAAELSELVAASPALSARQWTPSDGGGGDLGAAPKTITGAGFVAFPAHGGVHFRAAGWLSFRRLFADTVSYRTTGPPSRIA